MTHEQLIEALRDQAYAAYASLAMSFASLIAAVGAIIVSNRTARKLLRIEEGRDRLAVKQAAKAKLVASVIPVKAGSKKFRIENTGGGTAKDASVTVDGTPLRGHPAFRDDLADQREFIPGSSVEYRLLFDLSMRPMRSVRIEWTDDSGEPGVYEGAL